MTLDYGKISETRYSSINHKRKIDKFHDVNIKSTRLSKHTIKKLKKADWEKIPAKYIMTKELIYRIFF